MNVTHWSEREKYVRTSEELKRSAGIVLLAQKQLLEGGWSVAFHAPTVITAAYARTKCGRYDEDSPLVPMNVRHAFKLGKPCNVCWPRVRVTFSDEDPS